MVLDNNLYQLIYEKTKEGICILDNFGKIMQINPSAEHILGYKNSEAIGKLAHDLFHTCPKYKKNCMDGCCILKALRKNESYFGEELFFSKNGKHINIEASSIPLDENGKISGHLLMFHNINDRKKREETLKHKMKIEIKKRTENELFHNHIFETANLGICLTDKNGIFSLVNPAYCRIYGYEESELLGQHFTKVVPKEQKEQMQKLHDKFIKEEVEEIPREWNVEGKNGRQIHIVATAGRLDDVDGGPYKITTITDMSCAHKAKELQKTQEAMLAKQKKLAATDPLTGLFNRLKLDEIFRIFLNISLRHDTPFSIIMLDIDNFKQVNDTFGHLVGDKFLQEFSTVIKTNVRREDTVGRWGGEEFLILIPGCDLKAATNLAQKLRKITENFNFSVVGRKTASFGVSTCHQYDNEEKMIFRADEALYRAKNSAKNQVQIENYTD